MKSQKRRVDKLEEETATSREDIGRSLDEFYSEADREYQQQWYANQEEVNRLKQQHQKRLKLHGLVIDSNNKMRHYE